MDRMNRQDIEVYKKFGKKRSVFSRVAIVVGITLGLLLLIGAACFAFLLARGTLPFLKPTRNEIRMRDILKPPPPPKEPVNMLILGSDKRPKDPGRSDTIIFLRIFPKERKAVMLSIPRDYRVRIPGYGKRKINSAFAFGGPKLTIETVEEYTGFPINHYLEVNFQGFVKLVDELGGIDVFNEKQLEEHRETFTINLKPGWHHLNGQTALLFVRFRHDAEGDFGRMRRQQQFFKALMDKAVRFTNILKIPRLAEIARQNMVTDLSLQEMMSLGWLIKGMSKDNLITRTLPGDSDMINGVSYIVPDEDKAQQVLQAIKKPTITKAELDRIILGRMAMSDATLRERKARESIKLQVLNGTEISGVARDVAKNFGDLGFDLSTSKQAMRSNYPKSLLVYSLGQRTKALRIAKVYGYCDLVEAKRPLDVDAQLIVGNDFILREREH